MILLSVIENREDRLLQAPLDESEEFVKDGPWRLYAVARVEAAPGALVGDGDGPVLSAGLYSFDPKSL